MRFKTVERAIKPVLENNKEARADDMWLYLYYIASEGYTPLKIFSDRKYRIEHGLASYETVSRARRKLQAKYRELRPTPEEITERKKAEKEYKKYAKGGVY